MKHVLLLSPTFPPDVGGGETHMADLLREFEKSGQYRVTIATHKPIVTKGVKKYIKKEKRGPVTIYRFWWFGGVWHIFEKYPLIQFLYTVPYLLIRSLLVCLLREGRPDVIHANGFSCVVIGVVLKRIFNSKLIASTHAVYEKPKTSFVARFMKKVFASVDKILCLSDASVKELQNWGIPSNKIFRFRYWIQLEKFIPYPKKKLGVY